MTLPRFLSQPLSVHAACLVLGLALIGLSPRPAAADAAAGEGVVFQWCANCHSTTPGRRMTDAAPTFAELGTRKDLTREKLRTWLSTPHAGMPDFGLSREDIDSVVDYLQAQPR